MILTVGFTEFQTLESIARLSGDLMHQVGKSHTGKVAKAGSMKEAKEVLETGFKAVETAFQRGASSMNSVKDIAQMLRRLHTVDPTTPSVRPILVLGWSEYAC